MTFPRLEGLFRPKVERFPGDRFEPAFALWEIARPAPKVQEQSDKFWIFIEGYFGPACLAALPLA